MPKILEHGDGSKPTVYIIWPHLATPISAMKRSVRPLFGILLFAVLALTISCQIFDRHYFSFQLETNLVPSPVFNSTPPELNSTQPEFNSTLLEFASVDIGEEKSKQEVEQLLEANFVNQGRATWRRFNHQDVRDRATTRLQVVLRSPKFYRYWLDFRRNLNAWFRKKRFQPDIMMDLVKLVKLPIDRHNGLSLKSDDHTRYKSCAVVGNSGILLKSEYGELIDSHEFVIRLNNAMIERYESKVGSKTSLSFINSNILHPCARREGCYCHPYGVNVPIIMYICQPVHFLDYTMCNASHKAPLLVTDSRFDMLCARIVKYYSAKRFVEVMNKSLGEWDSAHDAPMFHYSSGMQAITLALGICDEVSVFGFGKSTSAKHHYHTNQQAELHLHDYEAEYDFYHDLVENPRAIPFISDRFKFPPVVIYH